MGQSWSQTPHILSFIVLRRTNQDDFNSPNPPKLQSPSLSLKGPKPSTSRILRTPTQTQPQQRLTAPAFPISAPSPSTLSPTTLSPTADIPSQAHIPFTHAVHLSAQPRPRRPVILLKHSSLLPLSLFPITIHVSLLFSIRRTSQSFTIQPIQINRIGGLRASMNLKYWDFW